MVEAVGLPLFELVNRLTLEQWLVEEVTVIMLCMLNSRLPSKMFTGAGVRNSGGQ